MILKASQRSGAMQLGRHLLKAENEHVEVHEVRGFLAEDVLSAMKEAQAVSQGTRCKQFLFSVSLSPPEAESVGVEAFEDALSRIEKRTGLTDQPRIVVFHEKLGRRHAHAVWSRIDVETMTAVPLPFFKLKLRELSKELYLEHGWRMPRGLMDSQARDPRNFDLAEWQQAKRIGRDPRQLKETLQECWAVSDSREAFAQALEERGLYLAKGDRRAHVAVTYEGEVLSVARMIGRKAKEVAAKLGTPDDLRSVADTRAHIAAVIAPQLQVLRDKVDQARTQALAPLTAQRERLRAAHVEERARLDAGIEARRVSEMRSRAGRLRKGVRGLWDRLTGQTAKLRKQNEFEALEGLRRDRAQRDALIGAQLKDRRELQRDILRVRHRHAAQLLGLHRDLARQGMVLEPGTGGPADAFNKTARDAPRDAPSSRGRQSARGQGRGMALEL